MAKNPRVVVNALRSQPGRTWNTVNDLMQWRICDFIEMFSVKNFKSILFNKYRKKKIIFNMLMLV